MSSVVFGYQLVGYRCLEALLDSHEKVLALFTHEDSPNETIWFPSVAELAKKHQIPVYTEKNFEKEELDKIIASLAPDFIFSFYYRKIIPLKVLAIPKKGAYNLHGSLLPKYRGRACINWAIIQGESVTGITLHEMEAKPDRGPIVAQKRVEIAFEDTALSVTKKIAQAGYDLLIETLPLLREGKALSRPQDHSQATLFGRRTPEDGKINWEAPALSIYNLVRAVTHPLPGAFTTFNSRKLYIWWGIPEGEDKVESPPGKVLKLDPEKGIKIAAGKGFFYIQNLQLEGEEECSAILFAQQHPSLLTGCILT